MYPLPHMYPPLHVNAWTHGHVDGHSLSQMRRRALSPRCSLYLCTHTHTHTHTHTQLWNWMKSSIFPERIDGIEYRCCPHCGAAIVKNGGYLCVGRTLGGVFCVCLHVVVLCVFACTWCFVCVCVYVDICTHTWYLCRIHGTCAVVHLSPANLPCTIKHERARKQARARARTHTHTRIMTHIHRCDNMRCSMCDGVFRWGMLHNTTQGVVEQHAPPSTRQPSTSVAAGAMNL